MVVLFGGMVVLFGGIVFLMGHGCVIWGYSLHYRVWLLFGRRYGYFIFGVWPSFGGMVILFWVSVLISLECLHTTPFKSIISRDVSFLQNAVHHFQVPTDHF